jgi:hypothetical protein
VNLLVGTLLLFAGGALAGGPLGGLLWVLAFLALASELLRRLTPGAPRREEPEGRRPWRGPISLDEVLIREELLPLALDPAATAELVDAARAFGAERGLDPLVVARAIAEAVEGEPLDLEMLGWPLRPGLDRAGRIAELRSRA